VPNIGHMKPGSQFVRESGQELIMGLANFFAKAIKEPGLLDPRPLVVSPYLKPALWSLR